MISDIKLESIDSSPYIRLKRAQLTVDNGSKFFEDIPQMHDSVSILLYHTDRQSLIIVKQFRPAVFLSRMFPVLDRVQPETEDAIARYCGSASPGYTYELCDGLIDNPNLSAMETAKKEVLEECGYHVPCEKIQLITTHRTIDSGSLQTVFYAEVDDQMKVSEGGGNPQEQEEIQVVYIPAEKAKKVLVEEESVQRCPDLMFAVLWFLENKLKQQ